MEHRITKEELTLLYTSMTTRKLCEKLDVTVPALYKMLDDNGIPRKAPPRKKHKRWVVE
jgi:hypothetical protein